MHIFLIILMVLMLIPLYFSYRLLFADKRRQKVYLNVRDAFKRLIRRHRLSIAEMSILGNGLIAMDSKMNKLVFVVYKNDITWEQCLNLHEIINCRIAKNSNKVNGYIQKVNLELTLRKEGIITFSFFDEEADDLRCLPSREKKAQYWKRKIQYQISTIQITNVSQIAI